MHHGEILDKGWGSSRVLKFEYYVHRAVVLGNTTSCNNIGGSQSR